MVKCWEHFKCKKSRCPNFGSDNLRCWLVNKTHCHGRIRGSWLEKIELCLDCPVFRENFSENDRQITFAEISRLFNAYKTDIEARQKQLETLSELLKTERNSLEQKVEKATASIRKMQAKLLVSSKMEALGAFAAGIAHNINNPLSGILNCVRALLSDSGISGARRQEYLELSLSGLQRIDATVKKILEFAATPRTLLEKTSIDKLLNESIKLMQYRLEEKKVGLAFSAGSEGFELEVEPSELQQVFMNLIANAIDAVDNGGKIEIAIARKRKFLEISFKDNGIGITKEDLKKIFNPFFSTKSAGSGVGLGLSISNSIIKRHKGKFRVKSIFGKGSVFTVILPVSENN